MKSLQKGPVCKPLLGGKPNIADRIRFIEGLTE